MWRTPRMSLFTVFSPPLARVNLEWPPTVFQGAGLYSFFSVSLNLAHLILVNGMILFRITTKVVLQLRVVKSKSSRSIPSQTSAFTAWPPSQLPISWLSVHTVWSTRRTTWMDLHLQLLYGLRSDHQNWSSIMVLTRAHFYTSILYCLAYFWLSGRLTNGMKWAGTSVTIHKTVSILTISDENIIWKVKFNSQSRWYAQLHKDVSNASLRKNKIKKFHMCMTRTHPIAVVTFAWRSPAEPWPIKL